MANVALVVDILSETTGLTKGLDKATKKVGGFEKTLGKLALPAAAVTGALTLVGSEAVASASRVEQSMGALDAVFGENSAVVKEWAKDAAQAVGLSESEYAELASVVGAQLNNMGLSMEDSMDGTKDLISVASDLAATFGGTTTDAVSALSSALKGEADPAEKYGLTLSKTAVSAKLAEDGLDKLTGTEKKAAEANAVLELATEQAGGALGSFTREADTLEGQQARTAAETENMKAALGESLLPIVTKVTTKLGELARFVADNSQAFMVMAGVVGGLAAAVLIANVALKVYRATTAAVTAATKLWSAATKGVAAAMKLLKANPIILIITAIVAAVAALIHLWNTSEEFRAAVEKIWAAISKAAEACWNAVKAVVLAVISWASTYIKAFMNTVDKVWRTIKSVATTVWNAIKAVINAVIKVITGYIKAYKAVVLSVWTAIKTAASAVWNAIKGIVKGVVDYITRIIRSMRDVVVGVWRTIRDVARTAWNAIKGIVKGVVDAIKNSVRSVKDVVEGVWNSIKSMTERIWNSISSAIDRALKPIKGIVDGIARAFDNVADAVSNVIGWISKIKIPDLSDLNPFKKSAPADVATVPGPALGGRLVAAPAASSSTTSGGTVVNINGALDPVAVARQVRAILRDDDRRRQGVRIIGRPA